MMKIKMYERTYSLSRNTMGTGAETYPSGVPEFTPQFFVGFALLNLSFLYKVLYIIVLS